VSEAEKSRLCGRCKKERLLSLFSKSNQTPDGLKYVCKVCVSEEYQENKESIKKQHKIYYEKNKEKTLQDSYKYRRLKPEKRKLSNRKNHLKREYGLSWEEFTDLYNIQEGKCKICGCFIELQSGKNSKTSACVDHCHNTLEVRGLLCRPCNLGIGNLQDNVDILKKAIVYLESFRRTDD